MDDNKLGKKMSRGPFLEAPGNYWARQAVLFFILDSSFKRFENCTVKLSANETKWTSLVEVRTHSRETGPSLLNFSLCIRREAFHGGIYVFIIDSTSSTNLWEECNIPFVQDIQSGDKMIASDPPFAINIPFSQYQTLFGMNNTIISVYLRPLIFSEFTKE